MAPFTGMLAFDPAIDPATFARDCRSWGVDTAVLGPDFFADGRMAEAIAAEGLRTWLNLPVFHRPQHLAAHPDHYVVTCRGRRGTASWLHMVCPSRDETVEQVVEELRSALSWVRPAVVSLDFIRQFAFWEEVDLDGSPDRIEDGCYCTRCLERFEQETSRTVRAPKDDPVAAATCLTSHLRQAWGDWKCRRIHEVAQRLLAEIRSLAGEALLAINTVPWRESDLQGAIRWRLGQDVPLLSRGVDLVAPMALTHALRRPPQWKRDLLGHIAQVTGKPVVAYVQVDALPAMPPISTDQFHDDLMSASAGPCAGTLLVQYEQVRVDPAKAAVLRGHCPAPGDRDATVRRPPSASSAAPDDRR